MDNRNLHFSGWKQKIIKGAVVFLVLLLIVGVFCLLCPVIVANQNGKEIQISKYHAEYTAGEIHVKWDGVLRYVGGVTNPNAKVIPESLQN